MSPDLQLKRPAQIVERPTGPVVPPPMPKPTTGQTAATASSLTLLSGALTWLAFTAMTQPGSDQVFYAIGVALAAIFTGAVVLYRSPRRVQ